jgi:quercetin dioxygenase-like cupin family protein
MPTSSSRVVQPGQGESYWQPVPARGFVEVAIAQRDDDGPRFDAGIQEVSPGCEVRLHAHGANEELILVLDGEGEAVVDGARHPMRPGTVLHLVAGSPHQFINADAKRPLRFYFVLLPGGLRDFFAGIGRPRQAGDPLPEAFPRPDDVEAIERRTVFAPLDNE